jgi:NADH:ubiquinone reductase (non-electrogenic)
MNNNVIIHHNNIPVSNIIKDQTINCSKNNNKETIHIIGFGWASIGFLKHIDTKMYNVVMISNNDVFNYTPLLAQNIKNNKNLTFSVNEINDKIEFNQNEVDIIDFNQNLIITKEENKIPYKYLIFSHGSTINTFNISGVNENTLFLKTAIDSEKIKEKLNHLPNQAVIAVIGCGLTGCEIIGTLLDINTNTNQFQIVAIDALPLPLPTFDKSLSNTTIDLWRQNSVKMYLNKCVSKINPKTIELKGENENIEFDLAIWCAGIKPTSLTEKINKILQLNCNRGIPVNKYFQVENTQNVYAIGDCAFSGFPPTAQIAYQQGKYLANQFNKRSENIQRDFEFHNNGQICYIGKGKSVFQNPYFKSSGNITYYLNKAIHMYYLFTIKK